MGLASIPNFMEPPCRCGWPLPCGKQQAEKTPRRSTHLYAPYRHLEIVNGEQWGLVCRPINNASSRAGSAADRLVRQKKEAEAQQELRKVLLSEVELTNVLHFKYVGVMQSGHGDPLTPICHRVDTSKNTFTSLQRTLTDTRLPLDLRLRLWRYKFISTLRHGCESWELTEHAQRKINDVVSKCMAKSPVFQLRKKHRTHPAQYCYGSETNAGPG